MGAIGNPKEYVAWVLDSATLEPLTTLPWSVIKWQRVRNDVSTGSVFISEDDGGIECCGAIGGLATWSQMLMIERNGTNVWDGPIMGWSRPALNVPGAPRGVTVRAQDRMVVTQHRLVGVSRKIPTIDPVTLAEVMQLLTDAGIGNPALDPYPLTIPGTASQAQVAAYDLRREYDIARLQRVYDALQDLVVAGGFFYSMAADRLHINELLVRNWADFENQPSKIGAFLDHYDEREALRPQLTEDSVVGIPGVDVDGKRQATTYYVATDGQGEKGFPTIGVGTITSSVDLDASLDLATGTPQANVNETRTPAEQVASLAGILQFQAQCEAVVAATPQFTIEQTRLAPGFGSESMRDDLTNLVPGVIVDIDFDSTCAFDVPTSLIEWNYRTFTAATLSGQGYFLTPVIADTIAQARLEQLDVTATSDDGVTEEVLASLTPWADWNGLMTTGWVESSYHQLGY